PERHAAWRPRARRTKYQVGSSYTEPYGSVFNAGVRRMQGVAAKNDASYDLSRARVAKSVLPTLGGTPMAWNTGLRSTEVVDLVDAEAARDDRFKWALGKIWIVA